jgi:O-antigen/teichoic acid export membrane protein
LEGLWDVLRAITWVVLGLLVVIFGFLFFSAGFATAANQPATFTIAGAVIMLGLVLFFQGIYRRGQESKPKTAS